MNTFEAGAKVKIRETGYEGTIEASNVAHKPTRYLVSYVGKTGATYQDWFPEDQLQESGEGQPAATGAGGSGEGAGAAAGDDEGKVAGEGPGE